MEAIRETICAIATPTGQGAQGTIKISGANAIELASKVFFPANKSLKVSEIQPYFSAYGWVKDSETEEVIDDAMLLVMKSPHSYTGEDQVELTCHGSPLILSLVMKLLIKNGARLAEPGEFTRRAFVNGKMDLSQAESVADLIAATNKSALRLSISQMRGFFRKKILDLREQLIHFASLIELELDFSEEDVEFVSRQDLSEKCSLIMKEIEDLAKSYDMSEVIKNGIPIAIVGSTNAGKSTLLNGLLREDKAIISDIHGTTRDIIEDTLFIEGQQFRIIDTAGIRKTEDVVESIGIERALQKADSAEGILWLIDPNDGVNRLEELYDSLVNNSERLIPVINKIDITTEEQINNIRYFLHKKGFSDTPAITAKNSTGIEQIRQLLHEKFKHIAVANDQVMVTNIRQAEALKRTNEALQTVSESIAMGLTGDLIAQDLRAATASLSEVIGDVTTDDLLHNIFAHFCIGK